MHPALGYHLANPRNIDLRQQAQGGGAPRAGRTRTRLTVDGARCEALFASGLQPSDAPGPDGVAAAVRVAVRQFGVGGCASRVAQEFGGHPTAAAERMRWVRALLGLTRSTVSPPAPGRHTPRGAATR